MNFRALLWSTSMMAAMALIAPAAGAQSQLSQQASLPLNRFNPNFAGDRFFGVASPHTPGHPGLHMALIGDYAYDPLTLRGRFSDGTDEELGAVVEHQLQVHVNGTIALFDRVALNFELPMAVYQEGDDPTAGDTTFVSPSGFDLGDIRIGLRGRLFGEYRDPFQLAMGAYVWLPSGDNEAGDFVGNGKARVLPQVIVGGEISRFVYAANIGVDVRAAQTFADVDQGTMLDYGVAIGGLLDEGRSIQLGADLLGAFVVDDLQERTTNLEVLGGVKWRFVQPMVLGLAAGPGLTGGIGTPTFRGVLSLSYSPEPAAPPVPVRQVVLDEPEPCPEGSERGALGCEPTEEVTDKDSDGDQIADAQDACPETAGIPDQDKRKNGCPPSDRDKDNIADREDACPDLAGPANIKPSWHGCPLSRDSDGDGIADLQDACPDQRGSEDEAADKNGCPRVLVKGKEIVILERVEFALNKSTIRVFSFPLLNDIATILKANPQIQLVEVQGHTDNRGSYTYNKQLSQQRAEAVVEALAQRGVNASRMVAKGYGSDKPIKNESTEAAHQMNRRVQIVILKQQERAVTQVVSR